MHIGRIERDEAAHRLASDPAIISVIRRHLITSVPLRPLQAVVCIVYAWVMMLIVLPEAISPLLPSGPQVVVGEVLRALLIPFPVLIITHFTAVTVMFFITYTDTLNVRRLARRLGSPDLAVRASSLSGEENPLYLAHFLRESGLDRLAIRASRS